MCGSHTCEQTPAGIDTVKKGDDRVMKEEVVVKVVTYSDKVMMVWEAWDPSRGGKALFMQY